jgi:phosphopantetheinyl transferase
MLIEKDPKNWQLFFFDLWTLKESYLKAIGGVIDTEGL